MKDGVELALRCVSQPTLASGSVAAIRLIGRLGDRDPDHRFRRFDPMAITFPASAAPETNAPHASRTGLRRSCSVSRALSLLHGAPDLVREREESGDADEEP